MLVQNFFVFFAYLFAGNLFFSGTGAVISRLLPRGLTSEPVLQPFHGILFWVLVFSAVLTKGKSIQLLILIYFILQALFESSNKEFHSNRWRMVLQNSSISFLLALPVLVVFYFSIFRNQESLTLPFMDEVFYGKLASLLTYKGIETNQIRVLWSEELGQNTPYHYFEIWLTSIFSWFSGISPLLTYKLLAIPTLIGTSCGILFNIARMRKLSISHSCYVVIFTVFTGIFFGYQTTVDYPIPTTIKVQLHYISDFIPLNRTKLATVFIFLSVFLFLLQKKVRHSWLPLILLGGLWISITPSIWVLSGFLLIKQRIVKKEFLVFICFILFSFLILFFIYYSKNKVSYDDNLVFFKYNTVKMIMGTIFYEILTHILVLFPALLAICYAHYRNVMLSDFVLVIPILVGIVLHSISIGSFDSFQFVSNVSSVCIPLIFFSFYTAFFSDNFRFISLKSGVFFLVIVFEGITAFKTMAYSFQNYTESYSKEFLSKISKQIKPLEKSVVTLSVIKGGHHDHARTNYEGAFFLLLNPKIRIAQINPEGNSKLAIGNDVNDKVQESPFLNFVKNSELKDYSNARIAFLNKFQPGVLVVNGAVDLSDYKELSPFLGNEIIDSLSGVRVFTLDYSTLK